MLPYIRNDGKEIQKRSYVQSGSVTYFSVTLKSPVGVQCWEWNCFSAFVVIRQMLCRLVALHGQVFVDPWASIQTSVAASL